MWLCNVGRYFILYLIDRNEINVGVFDCFYYTHFTVIIFVTLYNKQKENVSKRTKKDLLW